MRLSFVALLAGVAALSGAASAADAAKPPLVRGTVDHFDGRTLAVKTDTGAVVSLAVTPATHYAVVVKRSFAQLKPSDFIGVTAVPGANGHLTAEEIHTIPLVGLGEGQYPWEHHPSTASASPAGSMTNGTIASAKTSAMTDSTPAGSMTTGTVTASGGVGQLTMRFHGAGMVNGKCEGLAVPGKPGCSGTAIVDVPASTPIVAIVPGLHEDVKPGAAVVAQVTTDASAHEVVSSATLEKNGVKPEF